MFKISVIIPLYNVEKYIKECLDSIINQTIGIDNIEIILIDDCSTDNTLNIIKEYQTQYPDNIVIIEQETNQGPGAARNLGIEKSKGKYLTFLDGDDFISPNTYKDCIDLLEKDNDLDMVIYKYTLYNEEDNTIIAPDIHQLIYEKTLTITDLNKNPEIIFSTSPWNKIYTKKLIPYLKFPSMLYEDNITSVKTILNSQKIHITTDAIYYYRYEKDNKSRSQSITLNNIEDLIESIKQIISLQNQHPQYKNLLFYLSLKFLYDIIYWMLNLDFTYKQLEKIYYQLKELPTIDDKILIDFEEKFPIYTLHNQEALKDLEKLEPLHYFVKHRYYNQTINPIYEASIYIDTGKGFNDDEKITQEYRIQDRNISLDFNLKDYHKIKGLRFDPVENHLCSCIIKTISNNLEIDKTNAENPEDNKQIFLTRDPQYTFKGDFTNLNNLKISFHIHTGNSEDLRIYFTQKLAELNAKIKGLNYEIEARDKIIENKNNIINQRDQTIEEITESTSWKITQPLRSIKK